MRYGCTLIVKRLIMLQIQCDMFRSLWYFLHPVVVLIHGPVEDASLFCQISGFSISLATEASGKAPVIPPFHDDCADVRRLCRPRHCYTCSTLCLLTSQACQRRRLVSVSTASLRALVHGSDDPGFSGICQSAGRICLAWKRLWPTRPTNMVPCSPKLDAPLHHSGRHRHHLPGYLYVRPIQLQERRNGPTAHVSSRRRRPRRGSSEPSSQRTRRGRFSEPGKSTGHPQASSTWLDGFWISFKLGFVRLDPVGGDHQAGLLSGQISHYFRGSITAYTIVAGSAFRPHSTGASTLHGGATSKSPRVHIQLDRRRRG